LTHQKIKFQLKLTVDALLTITHPKAHRTGHNYHIVVISDIVVYLIR